MGRAWYVAPSAGQGQLIVPVMASRVLAELPRPWQHRPANSLDLPVIITPPLLDIASRLPAPRLVGAGERLLAFFDTAMVRLVAFLALTPLLWQALGDTRYGVVVSAVALTGLLEWPLRAFTSTAARMLIAAVRVDDTVRVRRIALMSWLLLSVLGLAMAGFLAWEADAFAETLGLEGAAAHDAADYLRLVGLRLAAQASMSTWQSAVLAAGLAVELASLRGVRTLLEVLLAFVVAGGGLSLRSLGAAELLIVGAWGAVLFLALRRAGPGWLPTLQDFDWRTGRALYAQGALDATQATTFLLTFDVAVLAVALVAGPELAAVLSVAAEACRLTAGTALQAGDLVFPRIAALGLATPRVERRWLVRRSADAALAVVGSLTVLWGVLGTRSIAEWLDVPWPTGLGMGIAMLLPLAVLSATCTRALVTVGLDHHLGPMGAAEVMLATIFCLGLIGPWGIGGAVVAILLAHALTSGWRAPWTLSRALKMPGRYFLLGRAWRFALAVVPALVAGVALASLKTVRSRRELLIVSAICLIFQAVAAFTTWYVAAQRVGMDDN